jgi:hypothetical protein
MQQGTLFTWLSFRSALPAKVAQFSVGVNIHAVLRCSDAVSRHFESIDALLAYENPKRAAIEILEISAHFREHGRAMIVLGSRGWRNEIEVSLQGEERDVMSLRSDLTDIIHGMRAWYSPIAVIRESSIWFAAFGVLVAFALFHQNEKMTPALLATGLACAAAIWAYSRIQRRCFPYATFRIGQGEERHRLGENIRWGVIVALVVGLGGAATWSALTNLSA